ncbi:MAG: hypothetical protein KDA42_19460, partial [Planctomycetales bacterium]|nr:hypothetical protein [Planctomycetales bacterium]
ERARLIEVLGTAPAHYAYVNANLQATLLGRELDAVHHSVQASVILDALVSKNMLRSKTTTDILAEFIRSRDSSSLSNNTKAFLIKRLLERLGLVGESFELEKKVGLYTQLEDEQAELLAQALTEYLENTVSLNEASETIHRNLPTELSDPFHEHLKAGISTNEAAQVIKHAVRLLDPQYDLTPVTAAQSGS